MKFDSISLVIATSGRPTLARTLASLRGQAWEPQDEILLIGDGPQPLAADLWRQFRLPGRYLECPGGPHRDWGHTPRNWVLDEKLATGDYLAALDDDDVWTPDALGMIRKAIIFAPDGGPDVEYRPLLFRMDCTRVPTLEKVVWEQPEIRYANVGTGILVVPNRPAKLARYTPKHGGDIDMIRDTCRFYPAGPVWREELICVCRP